MLKDRFVRGSALLFAAMMVGNIFGYFFQLAMARMLSVSDFGEMNALMSLLMIFGIPLGTLVNFFARESASYFSRGDLLSVSGLHRFGLSRLFWSMLPLFCLMALFSADIGRYLGITLDKVLLIFGCIAVGSFVTVNAGIIQGIQKFGSLSFITSGASILKFAFSIIFVWFGWGIYGPLGGLLATGLSLWGYSQWVILLKLPSMKDPFKLPFNRIYKYAGGLFLANTFFGVMTQADVMLVKHHFPPEEAGLYASASIMGKAVMYLPAAIVMALFPMVAANQAAGQSSSDMLAKAVGFTLVLSVIGALILYFFPEFVMVTVFGPRYLAAVPIVTIFGVVMLPMSLTMVLMNYLLAQGRTGFVYFMAVAATFEVAGIHFFSENLYNVLCVVVVAGFMALGPIAFYMIRSRA